MKFCAALVACTLTLIVAASGPVSSASAHAQLTSVTPQRGAVLQAAPKIVSFQFSEAVTGTPSAVRVYGPRGARVDQGGAFHPDRKSNTYAVALEGGLADGTYTATYQVVSADGHVISAGSTFSIGAPSSGTAAVSDLLAGQKAGPITRGALTLARVRERAMTINMAPSGSLPTSASGNARAVSYCSAQPPGRSVQRLRLA